ncbi:MAG TPA: replication endonuclease, partial [Phormidium sp.]
MIPQNNEIPSPVSQAVYLYPDGEVRYKIALHKRNGKNCGSDRSILQVESKCTTRGTQRVERLDRLRPGWGALAKNRKFTVYAKNTVRRAAGALELEFGKEKLAFTTLTVPGSYQKITKAVASYSGYIMNRIQTYLSDNYGHSDGSKYVLGVVELQKRGMLHWHFLIAVEDTKLIETLEIKMQKFWHRLLKQVSKLSGVDLFKRKQGDTWEGRWEKIKHRAVDVQTVKKSVVGYLAKYMSKGCKKGMKSVQKSTAFSPSRWWSCSDDAKALMHRRTLCWSLPKVDWESANQIIGLEVLASFQAFNMWNSKVINPYTKQLCALVGRGSYELCSEWVRDMLPV